MSKVYFLINSLGKGGAEEVVRRLYRPLNVEKIFLLERDVIKTSQLEENKLIFLSKHSNKTPSIYKTFYIPFYAYKLAKTIEKQSVVISFLHRANLVNVISKKIKFHKAVISERTNPFFGKDLKSFFKKEIIKFFYRKANLIVVQTSSLKNLFLREKIKPSSDIKVIPNPYPIEEIQNKAKEGLEKYTTLFKENRVILTVGRLTKAKGQWYLLRIFREIVREEKIKLVILGEGELKEYLVTLSESLGLNTYVWDRDKFNETYDVYFLGFQENPFKFMANSYMFVFPSLWEGFPNALVEALACGKLVVSADCPSGPREILAPDTPFDYQTKEPEFAKYGILMPTFDGEFKKATDPLTKEEKIWVETLRELLNNETIVRKYEQLAPKRAFDFHIDKIVPLWKEVIKELS